MLSTAMLSTLVATHGMYTPSDATGLTSTVVFKLVAGLDDPAATALRVAAAAGLGQPRRSECSA